MKSLFHWHALVGEIKSSTVRLIMIFHMLKGKL